MLPDIFAGVECAFDLDLVAPLLPPFPPPNGHGEDSRLAELTWRGALLIRGLIQRAGPVVSLPADKFEPLQLGVPNRSRDWT